MPTNRVGFALPYHSHRSVSFIGSNEGGGERSIPSEALLALWWWRATCRSAHARFVHRYEEPARACAVWHWQAIPHPSKRTDEPHGRQWSEDQAVQRAQRGAAVGARSTARETHPRALAGCSRRLERRHASRLTRVPMVTTREGGKRANVIFLCRSIGKLTFRSKIWGAVTDRSHLKFGYKSVHNRSLPPKRSVQTSFRHSWQQTARKSSIASSRLTSIRIGRTAQVRWRRCASPKTPRSPPKISYTWAHSAQGFTGGRQTTTSSSHTYPDIS